MKKSKIIASLIAAALAVSNSAALTVFAEDVNLDGTYNAYIGVQSASFTFRNAYDDATYGYGITAEDGTVWFDQLTAWDNNNAAVNIPTTFNDCEIAGNGSYTVSMSDFDFGEDETFNLLYVSTDIPLNENITITDVSVKMDGKTLHTFDEAFMDPDATVMMKWQVINMWNGDLGGADGMFGYMMPSDSIEISFTVAGFNYDKAEEEVTEAETAPAETEAEAEAETTAPAEEETEDLTTSDVITEAETEADAEAIDADADLDSSSDNTVLFIVIGVAAVAVICVIVAVILKKKKS